MAPGRIGKTIDQTQRLDREAPGPPEAADWGFANTSRGLSFTLMSSRSQIVEKNVTESGGDGYSFVERARHPVTTREWHQFRHEFETLRIRVNELAELKLDLDAASPSRDERADPDDRGRKWRVSGHAEAPLATI